MEHRLSTRIATEAQVTLYHHLIRGWAVGRVRDVSSDGALIELAGGSFPPNSPVTLVLHFHGTARRELLQIPAMVVRAEEGNIGVMYLEHDDDTARALRRLIDAFRISSHAREAPAAEITALPAPARIDERPQPRELTSLVA